MIRLEERVEGIIIAVRAQPGARRTAITGEHDGALRIAVTTAPEKGQANKAIVKILSKSFQLPKSAIELVSGTTSRQKKFLLRGLSKQTVSGVLEPILGDAASERSG